MKVKRVGIVGVSALLAVLLPSGTFTASASSPGPVQVSMFTSPPTDIVNLDTNWFTKYVEKKFDMKITWNQVPGADVKTKESLLLESGKYPDIFWGGSFTPVQALQYGSEGIFTPMNNLIKQYAPNLEKAIQTEPGLKQAVTAPNGDIYALPMYNWCWHCDWSSGMWINTHLLQKYHLSMPKTTTQFEHVLEVFKQHGVTPLSGTGTTNGGYNTNPLTYLMNAFIYDDQSDYFYINSGGKLGFAAEQPQWKQGLEYIHGLYAKGLIAQGGLTQAYTILQRQVNNLQVGAFPNGAKNTIINNYGTPQSHFTWWSTVPALKGPNGTQYAAFYGTPPASDCFAITNKASQAEQIAVMKLLNFIWTPRGTEMADFGPEGKYWTKATKGQKGMLGTPALFNTNMTEFYSGNLMQNEGWNQMGPLNQSYAWRNGLTSYAVNSFNGSESMLQLETMLSYSGHQPKFVYPGFAWIPAAMTQQYYTEQTNIDNYVIQWADEFIVGSKSLSKDWNSYIQGLQNLGLQQYMQMTQKYMGKPFNTSAFQKDQKDIKFLENLK